MSDNEPFVKLSRRLEAMSPVNIDGTPYGVWLIDIRPATTTGAVDVSIAAKNGDRQYTGIVHVDASRLSEKDFAELLLTVMRRIVRGELPPGARELL